MNELREQLRIAVQHHQAGKLPAAVEAYREVLAQAPRQADALRLLGLALLQQNQPAEAEAVLQAAVAVAERDVESYINLGLALKAQGKMERASAAYQAALAVEPRHFGALYNLGNVYQETGRLAEAVTAYEAALAAKPDFVVGWVNLGVAQQGLGRLAEAEASYRRALALAPGQAGVHSNLGNVLQSQGRLEAAEAAFQEAIRLDPDFADAWNNLGHLYWRQGDYQRAITQLRHALALNPDHAGAHNNLGNVYNDDLQPLKAVEHLRRSLELAPEQPWTRSNLLFILSYNVLADAEETLAAHREWDRLHGGAEKARTFVHHNNRNPERRLRIGYVSPDFRAHPVCFFIEPILRHHDPEQVEVFCYAEVKEPDNITRHIQRLAHHWRSTVGMSDEALAGMIHDDQIDVLIDLAGHTANHRLGAFAYKPAPIQATYLGYFTTTGLSAMDYWISDWTLSPRDSVEPSTETVWRLPRCCLVYHAADDAPDVAARDPAEKGIVFGSFNQISKVSPEAIQLWACLLHEVGNSRLLIKSKQLADETVRLRLREQFAAHGIDGQRLDLRGQTPGYADHLAVYGEVDIALDTIPRTGGSTTADALWMGVPVVTLAGDRYIQRLSATMLNAVGLDDLVASTESEYIDKAVSLARDQARLRDLRATLRDRMAASPLCDARDLSRQLEHAYRQMWRAWLA